MNFIRFLVIGLLLLVVIGCKKTRTRIPPDTNSKLSPVSDFYCPTENEQAEEVFSAATELAEEGKLEEAKDLYLKAIELDSGYCDAMDNLGLVFRRQGNIEKAIYWYKESLNLFPDNPVARQNLAVAYRIKGETKESIAEYEILIEINPDNPEGYYGLGVIRLLDQERPQEATGQFKKAEQLYAKRSSPLIADARYYLGVSYYKLQEWSMARDYFEQVYSELKNTPGINFFLGNCYASEELRNPELAKKYLSKAKELGVEIPNDVLEEISR